ncbi:VanZ family protein [Acidobacteriota bacterium]
MNPLFKDLKNFLGIFCIILTIGLIFVGLWPFEFSPKNMACWVPDGNGLYFDGKKIKWKFSVGGIAYLSSISGSSQIQLTERGSFTVAIHLQPEKDSSGGVSRILSIVDKSGKESLYLGQWKKSLIVRWFRPERGSRSKRKLQEIGVGNVLFKDIDQWLILMSDQAGTDIYVGDKLEKRFQGKALLQKGSSITDYDIVLGNSPRADNPWTGTILSLALLDRSFDIENFPKDWRLSKKNLYDADVQKDGLILAFNFENEEDVRDYDLSGNGNVILIPKRISSIGGILEWPDKVFRTRYSKMKDLVVNVFGFIPFGLFLLLWFKNTKRWNQRFSFLYVILIGGLLSLGIELTQVFIPARYSSLSDLLFNTVGTILGVIGLYFFLFLGKRIFSSKFPE